MSRTGYHGAELPGVDHASLADHNPFRAGKDKMTVNFSCLNRIDSTVDINFILDKVHQMVDRRTITHLIKMHVGNIPPIQRKRVKPVTPNRTVGLLDVNVIYITVRIGYNGAVMAGSCRRNCGSSISRIRRHKKAGRCQSHQHLAGKVIALPRTV